MHACIPITGPTSAVAVPAPLVPATSSLLYRHLSATSASASASPLSPGRGLLRHPGVALLRHAGVALLRQVVISICHRPRQGGLALGPLSRDAKSRVIATAALPVSCLREGVRSIQMNDEHGAPIFFCKLLVRATVYSCFSEEVRRHAPSRAVTRRHAPSRAITRRHAPSRAITRHHAPSRAVTRRHAPSRAVTGGSPPWVGLP